MARLFEDIHYTDICGNLTDPKFYGYYKDRKLHPVDVNNVLARAWDHNLDRILIPATCYKSCLDSLRIADSDPKQRVSCMVGCHPLKAYEWERHGETKYYDMLLDLGKKNPDTVKAVGKIGLDYHPRRMGACDKDLQLKFFEMQIHLTHELRLPVVLTCHHAAQDMIKVLQKYEGRVRGTVMSFDGTLQDAKDFEELGFFFGLSGCSLKTRSNLEVLKELPIYRMMVGSDAPRCRMGPKFAGFKYVKTHWEDSPPEEWSPNVMVRNRSEPPHLLQVLEVVAAIKDFDVEVLSLITKHNAEKTFFRPTVKAGDW